MARLSYGKPTILLSTQRHNACSLFIFSVFFFFNFLITLCMQYCISLRNTTQWPDIYITKEQIFPLNPVPIWPYIVFTILLTISPCCTLHSHDCFVTNNLYLLIPSPFHPSLRPTPIWQPSKGSLCLWVWLCLVYWFWCLDFTCKWNVMAFVLLWLPLL